MSFKDKIMNIITAHPKLVTFAIGLAITFVLGTVIGMLDHNQAFASGGPAIKGGGGGSQ
jgi:uncharacterized membrane protein